MGKARGHLTHQCGGVHRELEEKRQARGVVMAATMSAGEGPPRTAGAWRNAPAARILGAGRVRVTDAARGARTSWSACSYVATPRHAAVPRLNDVPARMLATREQPRAGRDRGRLQRCRALAAGAPVRHV
jgi:hypothetical protein